MAPPPFKKVPFALTWRGASFPSNSISDIKLGVLPFLVLLFTHTLGEVRDHKWHIFDTLFHGKEGFCWSCFSHVPCQSLTATLLSGVGFPASHFCCPTAQRRCVLWRILPILLDTVYRAIVTDLRWRMVLKCFLKVKLYMAFQKLAWA